MTWLFGRRRQGAVASRREQQGAGEGARGDYVLGESEAEISRLNFQHYMFRYAFGSEYSAPVTAPRDVLDVASGTGRWVREVARRFPQTNVIGFDINRDLLEASLAEGLDTIP